MHQYYIYGIGIHSEIKLYNLVETPVAPDVTIHYGPLPEDIIARTARGITSTMSPDRIWFRNHIGHFIIRNGNEILVHPLEGATEKDLASFLLGWSISFLFLQRGYSAIHCSAIEIDHNRAALIAGVSGAGKSTTALSLIDAGYRYLADDIIMVQPSPDMMIHPGFPLQKVCRNLTEQINPVNLFYIDERKDKFAYYNTADFCSEPRKLTTMIMLEQHNDDTIRVEELTGFAKWNCVLQNLFLLDAYKRFDYPSEEKARTLELAGKLSIYQISRPVGKDTVKKVRDIIINLLKENPKEA
ncbi:MAG: hypothetical protein E7268_08620 [Lachnospiraceae bacterium]|nr:hypothetical protein [Lachnospiraceae bacterium]